MIPDHTDKITIRYTKSQMYLQAFMGNAIGSTSIQIVRGLSLIYYSSRAIGRDLRTKECMVVLLALLPYGYNPRCRPCWCHVAGRRLYSDRLGVVTGKEERTTRHVELVMSSYSHEG
jgi:hypothetical protein